MKQTKPTPGNSPYLRTDFYNPADNPDLRPRAAEPIVRTWHLLAVSVAVVLITYGSFF